MQAYGRHQSGVGGDGLLRGGRRGGGDGQRAAEQLTGTGAKKPHALDALGVMREGIEGKSADGRNSLGAPARADARGHEGLHGALDVVEPGARGLVMILVVIYHSGKFGL